MKHLCLLTAFVLLLISNSNAQAWLKSNGRVGIGDYEPIARLQVNTLASFANPSIAILDSSGTNTAGGILQFRSIDFDDNHFDMRGSIGPTPAGNDSSLDFFFRGNLIMSLGSGVTPNHQLFYNPYNGGFRSGFLSGGPVGEYSVAMGYNNTASTTNCIAIGGGNSATAESSIAMGSANDAVASNAIALGYDSYAYGPFSIAAGKESVAGNLGAVALGENATATGRAALATGYLNLASGDFSTSAGYDTEASGLYSLSTGFLTIASNTSSSAFGFVSKATGVSASAFGYSTLAAGENSVAFNSVTKALGNNTLSSGYATNAHGWESSAFGNNTTTRSYASAVFGAYNDTIATSVPHAWVSADPLFMIGNGISNFDRNNALTIYKNGNILAKHPTAVISDPGTLTPPLSGAGTRLMWLPEKSAFRVGTVQFNEWDAENIGSWSFASGYNAVASEIHTTSIGYYTNATGVASTAIGYNTTASSPFAFAMGFSTIASEDWATSMGASTEASGTFSTAMGWSSLASGEISTAMGTATIARAYRSVAIGSYNDEFAGSSETSWVETDPIFYIGNSVDALPRSNAMVVYKNGNTDINGYTRLGKASEAAPKIKMKELNSTTGADYNSPVSIPHGLTAQKILSVSVLVEWDTNLFAPPEYSASLNLRYNYYVNATSVVIQNNTPNGDCLICDRFVKVLVTYKE